MIWLIIIPAVIIIAFIDPKNIVEDVYLHPHYTLNNKDLFVHWKKC